MEVLIFIMALLVSFPGKTNRAIKSLTALLVFPGIWQGHYGNNGPAILLIESALLCNYVDNPATSIPGVDMAHWYLPMSSLK